MNISEYHKKKLNRSLNLLSSSIMCGRPSENTLSAQGLKINNAKVNNLTVIEILIDPDVYSLILSCNYI